MPVPGVRWSLGIWQFHLDVQTAYRKRARVVVGWCVAPRNRARIESEEEINAFRNALISYARWQAKTLILARRRRRVSEETRYMQSRVLLNVGWHHPRFALRQRDGRKTPRKGFKVKYLKCTFMYFRASFMRTRCQKFRATFSHAYNVGARHCNIVDANHILSGLFDAFDARH